MIVQMAPAKLNQVTKQNQNPDSGERTGRDEAALIKMSGSSHEEEGNQNTIYMVGIAK